MRPTTDNPNQKRSYYPDEKQPSETVVPGERGTVQQPKLKKGTDNP